MSDRAPEIVIQDQGERDRRAERHRAQAEHNERLLHLLETDLVPKNPEFLDWAIVVTFYAALHYTKFAIMRDHGEFSPRHRGYKDSNGDWMAGHNDLVRQRLPIDVREAYKELFDRSQEARYRPFYRLPVPLGSTTASMALYGVQLATVKAACL